MNSDSPKTPREEMEAWLTSLLLGELSEGEAAAVRALMAHDPQLAKLHDRLKETISLVRETVPQMEAPPVPAEPLKLSDERRQKLLTSFKTVTPREFAPPKPKRRLRLVELAAVLVIVGLLAAISFPTVSHFRSRQVDVLGFRTSPGPVDVMESRRAATEMLAAEAAPVASSGGGSVAQALTLPAGRQPGAEPQLRPRREIILPAATEIASATEGSKVTFGNWGVSNRNGRGFNDGKTQLGQSSTLFAVDPQAAGVSGRPETSSANAFRGGYAYVPSASGPSSDFSAAKPEAAARQGAEANVTASGERLQVALRNSSDAKAGEDQLTAGGALIQPTTGPATEALPRGGAIAANKTPAPPEQTAFMRRYGLSPGKPVAGMGGGVGGGGVASSGGMALGMQPTPSQTVPGYVVVGDAVTPVPVLGDLRSEGKLFRSEQPTSETPRLGFSLLGPKSEADKPALGETVEFGAVAFDAGLQRSDPLKDGATGRNTSKEKDSDWFAGRLLAREAGVPTQSAAPPAVAAEGNVGRQSASIVLPLVRQEIVGVPAVEATEREVLARNGSVPARALRESGSPTVGKPTDTLASVRADEQLLVESRLNDAIEDRAKNRGRIPADSARGRIVAQAEKSDVKSKVTDGRILLEAGKLADAEAKLTDALKADPENRTATYYLALAKEQRFATGERELERDSKKDVTETPKQAQQLRLEPSIWDANSAGKTPIVEQDVAAVHKPSTNAPIPQPEIQTSENSFSTFSLNVSDVSFKLAAASLERGQMPDAASVRTEEFINAFDYHDPEPSPGAPIAFAWERARYPFAHNRDLLRFSLKTAAAGRQAGRPLNIVLLLDNSGSMERADRVRIIREALRVLASQLQPHDKLSVITFARTARLVADGISGDKAGEVTEGVSGVTPQGGTNFEEGMKLAYATALRHYLAGGINRVVMLTDGAANLGDVEPESLKQKVETHRKQGVALDCFGIGWEGYNDDLLEVLSRNGDGRYGFINSPEEAGTDFAGQLAGALKVAASDVKVQVEFNPKRVTAYRQIGYAKHQLTKEQFRDNTVDAAEIAAQEAGNALYTVEVNPAGEGPLCTLRVRFRFAGTWEYREQEWDVPYSGNSLSLEQSSPAMRLAASASAFSEWLVASPFAGDVTPDRVLGYLSGVPEVFGVDARLKKLEWMIRQAKSIEAK